MPELATSGSSRYRSRVAGGPTGGSGDQTVLDASGYVTARRRATVSARVTGRIAEVLVEEGMPARQGQVLARLDDSSARAALELAEAQLAAARSSLDEIVVRLREAETNRARAARLADAGVMAGPELTQARQRLLALEVENQALRDRVGAARDRLRILANRLGFLEQDADEGAA